MFHLYEIISQKTVCLSYLWIQHLATLHSLKSVQMRSYFWSVFSCIRTEYGDLLRKSLFSPNAGKHGPEITLYLDTFHAVLNKREIHN